MDGLLRSMSVDATAVLTQLRKADTFLPIRIVQHSLLHCSSRQGERSANSARMTITVNGIIYESNEVAGSGPFHALDQAFRDALIPHFGDHNMSNVRSTSFALRSRQENSEIEGGVNGEAQVVIGFMAEVNPVPPQSRDSQISERKSRSKTGERMMWNTQSGGSDSIDATLNALCDGYNFFALRVARHVSAQSSASL